VSENLQSWIVVDCDLLDSFKWISDHRGWLRLQRCSVAVRTLCTLRQFLMSELWARVVATLQYDGDRTVVTSAETGCSLNARELLAEVS
jgi:hypothetical protein